MEFSDTNIPGALIINFDRSEDQRGSFIKTFHEEQFIKAGALSINFKENYFSFSKKNVIRGMHFQIPPYQHAKLVYCIHGKVTDVILDLRKNSPSFGKIFSTELSLENHRGIYIPEGVAHGFIATTEEAGLMYNVTSIYNKEADQGILFNSFGFDWMTDNPILSDRDLSFPEFKHFNSPF